MDCRQVLQSIGELSMTPEEFEKAIQKAIDDKGGEGNDMAGPHAHSEMDEIMCCLLRELGYGAGIDVYEKTERWHE